MENEIIEIVKNLVSIIKSNNLKSISIQSKELSIQPPPKTSSPS